MQASIVEHFTNSAGWHVKHNEDTHLFELVSEKGQKQRGSYTTRTFAENALMKYLTAVQQNAEKMVQGRAKTRQKKKDVLVENDSP